MSNPHQNLNITQNSVSVIISPGTDNTATIAGLETQLKSFAGVTYKSYCSNHNVYILEIDKSVYATAQLFYNNLKYTTNISTLLLKAGNPSDILPFCETSVPKTTQTIEAEKALLDK